MGMTRQPTVLGPPTTAAPTVASGPHAAPAPAPTAPTPVTPAAVASAALSIHDDERISFYARESLIWLQAGGSGVPTASGTRSPATTSDGGSRAPTQQGSPQPTVQGSSVVRAPVDQGYPLNLDRSAMLTASVVMPFFACEILFYLGGLPWTAPLVRMIVKITEGTMTFLVVLLLMIVTFAGSFVVLFINLQSHSQDESTQATEIATIQSYGRFEMALSTVFCFLFGQFDTDDFTLSRSASLATLLLFMFLFFVVIIMLNLLIAMMGDKYDEVQERATAEAMYAKAKLVWEYDVMLRYFYGNGAAERRQLRQQQGQGQRSRSSHDDELLREARLAEDEEDDEDVGCGGFAPGSWIRDYLLPTDSLFPCATTALRWWRRRRAARHRSASAIHRRRRGDAAALHSLDLDEDTDEDADGDEAMARAAAADGSATSLPLLPQWQRRYYPVWIQILKKEALDVTYDPAADHDSDSDGDGRLGHPGAGVAPSPFGAMDTSSTSGSDSASDADESGPSKPSFRRKPSSLSSFLARGASARAVPTSGGVDSRHWHHRTSSHGAAGHHRASTAMPTMTATAASMNPAAAVFGAPAQRWAGRMSAFKNNLQRETMVWQYMLQQQLAQQEQHVASLVAQQAQYLQSLHQEASARVEEQLHEQRQLLHRLVTVASMQAQPEQSASSLYSHPHYQHGAPASFDEPADH